MILTAIPTADPSAEAVDNLYGYAPDRLPAMIATADRQRAKDALFVEMLGPYFVAGPILEIGAGCGQISELLAHRGFNVTASDVQPFLVEHIRSRGVRARIVDALRLRETIDQSYANILAGGLSTLITPDLDVVRLTYESVAAALPPGGRFIFVLPNLRGEPWSKPGDHVRIARESGLDLVARFRHQVLPSSGYRRLPAPLLRFADRTVGRVVGIRVVLVYEPSRGPAAADPAGAPTPL